MDMKRDKRQAKRDKARPERGQGGQGRSPTAKSGGTYWAFGLHPVAAGLANSDRRIGRLIATKSAADRLAGPAAGRGLSLEIMERPEIDRLVGADSVHQGVAAQFHPLPAQSLEDVADSAGETALLLVLDQVTDPHNVGAILRSAAVFGASGVILQDRNAPPESGALAKSASGALESVPLIRIGNLAQALDRLRDFGFWSIGLAGEAAVDLGGVARTGRIALVMGSEGDGLRRLTAERCDQLARIAMAPNAVGSLNVSNAAAVALYALTAKS